jgi:hypothetical protein
MEPTRLEDLPALVVRRIVPGEVPRVSGTFTHLRSVELGRSWLYDRNEPLIGDLVELDPRTREAVFEAPFWTPGSPIQAGTSAPWLNAYFQAWHVSAILDSAADWRRVRFEPVDAQHFVSAEGIGGLIKAGAPLPDGAEATRIEPRGWDHEHCSLCMERIGRSGTEYGYLAVGPAWVAYDCWLCDPCGERYAVPRSLGFVWMSDRE